MCWICPPLNKRMKPTRAHNFFPEEVVTLMSDRQVDFRLQNDRESLDTPQTEYLGYCLGPIGHIASVRQIHGSDIWVVDKAAECERSWPRADGLLTDLPGVALSVRTADCLPIFLFDPHRRCIGLVHAGWKGSQRRVVQKAIRLMQRRYRCRPIDIRAYFGPGIRPCCYRVGQEFRNYFPKEIQHRDGFDYLDLGMVNKNQLCQAGLPAQNIFISPICTCCCEDFFSYRREGENTGRHLSLIMLQV